MPQGSGIHARPIWRREPIRAVTAMCARYSGPMRVRFASVGAVLALGAPVGLLWIRSAQAGVWPAPEWIADELASMGVVYAYVALSTLAVFTAFGWRIGRMQDTVLATSLADPLT